MSGNIDLFPLQYMYFKFGCSAGKHELRMVITNNLNMEWKLYINDEQVGRFWDTKTNVLIKSEFYKSLDYRRVLSIYKAILTCRNEFTGELADFA
jgi:hypothetical protein